MCQISSRSGLMEAVPRRRRRGARIRGLPRGTPARAATGRRTRHSAGRNPASFYTISIQFIQSSTQWDRIGIAKGGPNEPDPS